MQGALHALHARGKWLSTTWEMAVDHLSVRSKHTRVGSKFGDLTSRAESEFRDLLLDLVGFPSSSPAVMSLFICLLSLSSASALLVAPVSPRLEARSVTMSASTRRAHLQQARHSPAPNSPTIHNHSSRTNGPCR